MANHLLKFVRLATMVATACAFGSQGFAQVSMIQAPAADPPQEPVKLEVVRSLKGVAGGSFSTRTVGQGAASRVNQALSEETKAALASRRIEVETVFASHGAIAIIKDDRVEIALPNEDGSLLNIGCVQNKNYSFITARIPHDLSYMAAIYIDRRIAGSRIRLSLWQLMPGKSPCTGKPALIGKEMSLPLAYAHPDAEWFVTLDIGMNFFVQRETWLASNFGGEARVWRLLTEESGEIKVLSVQSFFPPGQPKGVDPEEIRLSRNGGNLAVYFYAHQGPNKYDRVHVWNLTTGQQTPLDEQVYTDMAFSDDSRLLAVSRKADRGLPTEHTVAAIFDIETWKLIRTVRPFNKFSGISVLRFNGSSILAMGGNKWIGYYSIPKDCFVAQDDHPHPFRVTSRLQNEVSNVEFSGGGLAITSTEKGDSYLYKVTGNLLTAPCLPR